ncbi:hypothetical protein BHM03_00047236 [Ensete ventricosum]|nr:hypothetical protein BHM03_00047236 [Ensete ventricosum]
MASPRSPLAGAASASAMALKSSLGIDGAMAGKQREMAAAGSLPGGRAELQQHCWKRLSLGGTGHDSGGAGEVGGGARPTELDGGIVVHLGSLLGSVERVESNPNTTLRIFFTGGITEQIAEATAVRGRRKCGWKRRKKVLPSIFRPKKKLAMAWDVLSFDSE